MERRHATYLTTLSTAGFAATAVGFGPARMGFGIFVPEFREAFSLSTTWIGLISSLGFIGFFLGLMLAQFLLVRRGPETPVLLGLLAATVGIALVAAAPNTLVLTFGVVLAMSSAGFTWSPFNDAVNRKVSDAYRPAALSRVSTGTAIGIALAGAAAFASVLWGVHWRVLWAAFAVASAGALVANYLALEPVERARPSPKEAGWRGLVQPRAVPLYLIAFVYGIVSSIYISFTADRLTDAGGVAGIPTQATPGLVFAVYGLAGFAALTTDRVKAVTGLLWLLRLLMLSGALSLVFVALMPGRWSGLLLSAALQGVFVMTTSAVLSFWSERLFPVQPSRGFTATLLATAGGSIIGPAAAGWASDGFGPVAMFLTTAALPAATAVALRARHAVERPFANES